MTSYTDLQKFTRYKFITYRPKTLIVKQEFWVAFKGKSLHMEWNKLFGIWNTMVLQICFKHMFN